MDLKKKDLTKLLIDYLDLGDYRPVSGHGGISLQKRDGSNRIEIGFAYSKYEGYMFHSGISGRKAIDPIESILIKYYKRYSIDNLNWTIRASSSRIPTDDNLWGLQLTSEKDFLTMLPHFRRWVYEEVLPELDKYNNVGDVYARTMELSDDQRQDFIYPPFATRLLIMKGLLKTDDFEEYGKFLKNATAKNAKDPRNLYIDELIEELRTMP